MKHIFYILLCTLVCQVFSQKKVEFDYEYDDTIFVSPVLELKDSTIERIFDIVLQEEKNSKHHNDSNLFVVYYNENHRIGALEMYIEVSDKLVVWENESIYYYGCMNYRDRRFMIFGKDATLFFKKTEEMQPYDVKRMLIYDSFPLIVDPYEWWYFYYYNDIWLYYDFEKHKWMYYNYKERKWVDSE